jgi:hypothetical protein
MTVSSSESEALAEIKAFKNPKEGWFEKVSETADSGIAKATDRVFDTAVGEKAEQAVAAITKVLNDAAAWTVRREAILTNLRESSLDVDDIDDIRELPLDDIRQTIRRLDLKYRIYSAIEGAATGAVGVLGIAIDVPALVTLCLRAVNEYATYFGFDIELPHERYYALMVLSVTATGTDAERLQALDEITRVAKDLNRQEGPLPDMTPNEGLIDRLAQALAARLGKAKLAQLIPIVGAAIGGGFNRAFLDEVCDTAELLYTERWLIRKHGPELAVDVTT